MASSEQQNDREMGNLSHVPVTRQLSFRVSLGKEQNFILYIHLGGRHVSADTGEI